MLQIHFLPCVLRALPDPTSLWVGLVLLHTPWTPGDRDSRFAVQKFSLQGVNPHLFLNLIPNNSLFPAPCTFTLGSERDHCRTRSQAAGNHTFKVSSSDRQTAEEELGSRVAGGPARTNQRRVGEGKDLECVGPTAFPRNAWEPDTGGTPPASPVS
jgi:hypothetical protein